jgi:hypothetical protein
MICIQHEFIPTRYGMIKVHLETMCCHVICLHHSICIVTICMHVSAPSTWCLFVPHDMHPARVCFDTIRYDTVSSRFRHETICCHVICQHQTLKMYCNEMYLCFFTKHLMLVSPHDMHPARVRFDTIRYDTITSRLWYKTICYHIICLHETLDMYCNDVYLCFCTILSIRICPVWYVSSTSSFQHDTVWSNFISRRYVVM